MWITELIKDYKRPIKLSHDLINSSNKKVLAKGEKLGDNSKKTQEKGLKSILISNDQIVGKYLLNEVKDNNGEVLVGQVLMFQKNKLTK